MREQIDISAKSKKGIMRFLQTMPYSAQTRAPPS
jgi:hypothetical protein